MNKLPSLSIFFPFYNEEDNIERMALTALEVAPRFADEFEIILVNDGSLDRTGTIADRLAEEHPQIRAVHNRPNVGYGGAVRRGFADAQNEYIFFTDGDGQFDLNEIDRLVALLGDCDIAVGYRAERADAFMRKVNAWGWRQLIRLLFGVKVRDIDCAFKLLPKSFIDSIELQSDGAMISAELLAKARYRGLRIGETPVTHLPRTAGSQSGANFKVIVKAFRELFRLRRRIRAEGLGRRDKLGGGTVGD
jgi:glycosyltransferase involved in cell wall biosynthesis